MKRNFALLAALLWLSLACSQAWSQGNSPGPASDWVSTPEARLRLLSAVNGSGGEATVPLGLQFQLQPGWKTYWRSPGDAGLPVTVDWAGSTNLAAADFAWPVPMRFTLFGLDTFGYEGEVVFPIRARPADPAKPLGLRLKVDYLVCAKVCIPRSTNLALDLPAGQPEPSDYAQLIDRFAGEVPGDGAAHGLTLKSVNAAGGDKAPVLRVSVDSLMPLQAPDLIVEGPGGLYFPKPRVTITGAGHSALFEIAAKRLSGGPPLAGTALTITVTDGNRGLEAHVVPQAESGPPLWPILLAALLGGLVLNLMPCVLPVLSLKLIAFVGHSGKERAHVRWSFLASTAGVLASFLALASLLAGLRAAGQAAGWGVQFQHPLFLSAMALMLTALAGNVWGWYEIPLPGFAGRLAEATESQRGLLGDFLTGALATLLATPCTAPFLSTAVGFALAGGTAQIFGIFLLIGLGLSVPYLLVAAMPELALHLPHPGRWMLHLKRVLGLGLAGTALWLLYVLAGQVGLGAALATGAALVVVAALLALEHFPPKWTPIRRRKCDQTKESGACSDSIGSEHAPVRLPQSARAAGLGIAALAAILAPSLIAAPPPPAVQEGVWQPFSEMALADLLGKGRTVLVDATAAWCINCQVNKALVFDRGWTADALLKGRIAGLRADWTNPDPAIARYLASFGRYGIPFDAVYGPRAPQGVPLPSLLSEEAVRKAVETAGGG
ncbi:MAG TPA: protein-disulfide reductase DsbD domain-containing protein [Candidatus Udaeobacter sp.]|nr:protein-disulfide reductase DsbD domain-containing protein [Candidatus Udaeobacter sp.]